MTNTCTLLVGVDALLSDLRAPLPGRPRSLYAQFIRYQRADASPPAAHPLPLSDVHSALTSVIICSLDSCE